MIIFVPAALLLIGAVYFWIKDLYSHSFKDAEDRKFLFQFVKRILFYLPIALQAIFLCCYALLHAILMSAGLPGFMAFNISAEVNDQFFNLEPMKIVFVGSLLLASQYVLLKRNLFDNKNLNDAAKSLGWLLSILFLKVLCENILYSPSLSSSDGFAFRYTNSFLFLFAVVLVLVLAILKGEWIYNNNLEALRYLAFTARVLCVYTVLILLILLPQTIFIVIKM